MRGDNYMKHIKTGKSIVNYIKKMKKDGSIEDYKIDIDDDGACDIRVDINKDYGLNIYPEYSANTGKFTEWSINFIHEGHSMYYCSYKTQK